MAGYIYKPNTRKGPVFLAPTDMGAPTITGPDGKVYTGVRGDQAGGVFRGHDGYQYVFPREVIGLQGSTLTYGGQKQTIGRGDMSYRGEQFGSLSEAFKGSMQDPRSTAHANGMPPGPNMMGQFGVYPGYVGGMYPNPVLANFDPIKAPRKIKFDPVTGQEIGFTGADAPDKVSFGNVDYKGMDTSPYQFTDPGEFASKYGDIVRGEMGKNINASREFALDTLETELQGLKNYVPGAATLKRSETSLDNQFNQAERTRQVNQALPTAEGDLAGQRDRATAFAEGRLPSGMNDRALSLSARSRAADMASAGGFGAQSSAARKASDLMEVGQRIQLSQYGDQLLSRNLEQKAQLYLAPTQYSNAGSQINVNPSATASQLATSYSSQANQMGILPVGQALQTEVQQNQYETSLEQQTRQINTQNQLNTDQFNAQGTYNAGVFNTQSLQQNRQFNAQMQTNVNQFNAGMRFNAQQVNSQGRFSADQYNTNMSVGVAQYNAGNNFQESQINAKTQNDFALGLFQYNSAYASAMAGAAQNNINTQLGLAQQQQGQAIYQDYLRQSQQVGQTQAIAQGLGQLPGIITAAGQLFNVGQQPQSPSSDVPGSSSPQVNTPSTGGVTPPMMTPNVVDSPTSTPSGTIGQNADGTFITPSSGPQPIGQNSDGSMIMPSSSGVPVSTPVMSQASTPQYASAPISQGDAVAYDTQSGTTMFSRSLQNDPQAAQTRALMQSTSNAVMSTAGVYDRPQPGLQMAGYAKNGRPVYVAPELAQSNDISTGQRFVNTVAGVLDPTGTFTREDASRMQQIGQIAGDASLLMQLDAQHRNGDTQGFMNTVLNRFGQPTVDAITKDPQNRLGASMAFTASNMLQNWDNMSTAQKGLAVASLGLKGFKFSNGQDLATKHIIQPKGEGQPGLNVGQALNLMAQGVNVYQLINQWDQMNTFQKAIYGTGSAAQIAATAQQMNLFGAGANGAAVGVSASQLAASGFTAAPAYGVGAMTAAQGTAIPAGYTAVGTTANGQVIAAPASNASTFATNVAGGIAIAAGAYQVYQGWKEGGAAGREQMAVGGSSIIAGYSALTGGNAYAAGAVAAYSIAAHFWGDDWNKKEASTYAYATAGVAIGGTVGGPIGAAIGGAAGAAFGYAVGSGKGQDQVSRDMVRDFGIKAGVIEKDYHVTLADGTRFNVGVDGKGGLHQARNIDKMMGEKRDLFAYDVDYTNDLDFTSSMGTNTLASLLMGTKNEQSGKLAGQLANAGIGNIGFGKDMTPENFMKMTENVRGFFAKSGIKDANTAKQLINQGFAEKRWNDIDTAVMHQAVEIFFNDNYDMAQKLMAGRWNGIKAAHDDSVKGNIPKPATDKPMYAKSYEPKENAGNFMQTLQAPQQAPQRKMTKEEIQRANAERYQVAA